MHILAGMWPVPVAACVGGVVAHLLNIIMIGKQGMESINFFGRTWLANPFPFFILLAPGGKEG